MRSKCIEVSGLILGIIYSIFGLSCFAISQQYDEDCGMTNLTLQTWLTVTGVLYYLIGLYFGFLSTLVDHKNRKRCVSCTWVVCLLTNVLFTITWSVIGAVTLSIDEKCQHIAQPVFAITISTLSAIPVIGIVLSSVITFEVLRRRESELPLFD